MTKVLNFPNLVGKRRGGMGHGLSVRGQASRFIEVTHLDLEIYVGRKGCPNWQKFHCLPKPMFINFIIINFYLKKKQKIFHDSIERPTHNEKRACALFLKTGKEAWNHVDGAIKCKVLIRLRVPKNYYKFQY